MEIINRLLGRHKKSSASEDDPQQKFVSLTATPAAAASTTTASSQASDASTSGVGGLPKSRSKIPDGLHLTGAAALSAVTTAAASAIAVPSLAATSSSSSSSSEVATAGSASATPAAAKLPNVSSCCPKEKWAYERCFQHWYTAEYLKGTSRELSGCAAQFDVYRKCVMDYYETHDPDVLVAAGGTSDRLLIQEGSEAFGTKYAKSTSEVPPSPKGKK